jgi:DNA-binding NtrC family response regulator
MTARRRVLVVDDDADQLETLRRGLFLLGIDCLTACCVAEALAQLERVDLLLTDLTKPGKPGAELIPRARAARPELPVLVITGLALSPEVMAMRGRGVHTLRTPFTADQLGLAIEALLRAR